MDEVKWSRHMESEKKELTELQKEVAANIAAIERQRIKITLSKETATAFLVELGVCDKSGNLTPKYGGVAKP
jgi:hypothetical protein